MSEMKPGKGLDCGTAFIVSAQTTAEGEVQLCKKRNAFFGLTDTPDTRKILSASKAETIYGNGKIYVLGDDALKMANSFRLEARRPMFKGVLSNKDDQAIDMMTALIEGIVGKPTVKGEAVCFTVPARPIDLSPEDFDTSYHEDKISEILSDLGYTPYPVNEALCLAYSELHEQRATGINISCLVPGTKIYTKRGILNIEDVLEGDEVISHLGRWRRVNKVISKLFEGISTNVQIQGYSNTTEDYRFVDNHELFIYRNGHWAWYGCEELKEEDIVGEAIIQQNFDTGTPTITICERITCSKEYTKKHINVSSDVQRLIGYFLADGSIVPTHSGTNGGIQFDFNITEEKYVKDVQEILLKNFGKESSLVNKSDNCLRLQCYSVGIGNWFKNHCYLSDKTKTYPWDLSRLSKGNCLNLLAGLVRGDGWVKEDGVYFGNTTSNLIILARQLFSRLGIPTSLSVREPRSHALPDGRIIQGKKPEWTVGSSSKLTFNSLCHFINSVSCENSGIAERLFIQNNFLCSRIQKIEHTDYQGLVYDLQIEEDHSFSGPYLTIHNCGAGMVNVCMSNLGEATNTWSIAKSGDWIDKMVASRKAGLTSSKVTQIKENPKQPIHLVKDFGNPDQLKDAIVKYYIRLIKLVVGNLEEQFKDIYSDDPLPVVVAGGTSLIGGFMDRFKEELSKAKFGFELGEVRQAKDPLNSIAIGAMLRASLKGS